MQVKFYTPHILLQEFVHSIMIVHVEAGQDGPPVISPYPPTPQNSLFFYINDPIKVQKDKEEPFLLQPRSVVVGPQLTRVSIDINRNHKSVRVAFHPGGLFRLMGIPLSGMVDESYDATAIFGGELAEINERLQEATHFDGIKELIENFLLQKTKALKKALPFDQAMLELVRLNGNVPIEHIASLACLSLRQFERVCKERIGMSPKLFARVARFSNAYHLHESNAAISWTSIAYECGYFDQMHLIRDFKEFAGVAPGVIEKELAHLPLRMQAGLLL